MRILGRHRTARQTLPLQITLCKSWIRSKNYRKIEVGRDLHRSSSPTSLLKHGHLEPAALNRQLLSFSTDVNATTSLGNLYPCSVTFKGGKIAKKYFLLFHWNLLGFRLYPLPLAMSLNTTVKGLEPFLQIFIDISKIPHVPSTFQALSLSSCMMCSSPFNHLSDPSLDFLQ